MTKTAKWKSQRHVARAEKRSAKARQRAQNARKPRRGYDATRTPQIAPNPPFLQLSTGRSGFLAEAALKLVERPKVTVFQSNRRAA